MFKPRRDYSQHWLVDPSVVKQLIATAAVGQQDTVIEIGPGQGHITLPLTKIAHHVIAIDLDHRTGVTLRQLRLPNLTLIQADALQFPLPVSDYKLVANLPFAIEGKLLRKILDAAYPPQHITVITRHEPALRWTGKTYNCEFYCRYFPWFELEYIRTIPSSAFRPQPKVRAALININLRPELLLSTNQRTAYFRFLQQAYQCQNLQQLTKKLASEQLTKAVHSSKYRLKIKPTQVEAEQWVEWFKLLPC